MKRLSSPSRPAPETEERCSRTGCTLAGGSDLGEAAHAVLIRPGEEIVVGNGRRFRVLDEVRPAVVCANIANNDAYLQVFLRERRDSNPRPPA